MGPATEDSASYLPLAGSVSCKRRRARPASDHATTRIAIQRLSWLSRDSQRPSLPKRGCGRRTAPLTTMREQGAVHPPHPNPSLPKRGRGASISSIRERISQHRRSNRSAVAARLKGRTSLLLRQCEKIQSDAPPVPAAAAVRCVAAMAWSAARRGSVHSLAGCSPPGPQRAVN